MNHQLRSDNDANRSFRCRILWFSKMNRNSNQRKFRIPNCWTILRLIHLNEWRLKVPNKHLAIVDEFHRGEWMTKDWNFISCFVSRWLSIRFTLCLFCGNYANQFDSLMVGINHSTTDNDPISRSILFSSNPHLVHFLLLHIISSIILPWWNFIRSN